MPTFTLDPWTDNPLTQYRIMSQVWALMLFPSDFASQEEWLACEAIQVGDVYASGGEADVADAITKTLVGAQFYPAMVRVLKKPHVLERVYQAERTGTIAGDI